MTYFFISCSALQYAGHLTCRQYGMQAYAQAWAMLEPRLLLPYLGEYILYDGSYPENPCMEYLPTLTPKVI